MALHWGEWLLLGMMVIMVVYSLWESDKAKRAVIEGRKTKLTMYKETILFLWLPTTVLMALMVGQIVEPGRLGLTWQHTWNNWLGAALILLVGGYFTWHLLSIQSCSHKHQALAEAMQQHAWMMPESKRELRWFTLGVSMSAGICEELLFRGFFMAVFSPHWGTLVSLLVGSVVFGLCHIYQGWTNVLRTGLLGLVLGGIYVFTESLLVVIALHALLDIYGGILGYIVRPAQSNNGYTISYRGIQ